MYVLQYKHVGVVRSILSFVKLQIKKQEGKLYKCQQCAIIQCYDTQVVDIPGMFQILCVTLFLSQSTTQVVVVVHMNTTYISYFLFQYVIESKASPCVMAYLLLLHFPLVSPGYSLCFKSLSIVAFTDFTHMDLQAMLI